MVSYFALDNNKAVRSTGNGSGSDTELEEVAAWSLAPFGRMETPLRRMVPTVEELARARPAQCSTVAITSACDVSPSRHRTAAGGTAAVILVIAAIMVEWEKGSKTTKGT